MVFFERLYFELFLFYNKWNQGNEKISKWNAFLGVSFIMYINTYSVLLLLHLLGVKILKNGLFYFNDTVMLMSVFLILNYFLFLFKGKYKRILTEFSNTAADNKKKRSIIQWSYVAFSFVLLFILAYLYQ
jgi:hypothetical protein